MCHPVRNDISKEGLWTRPPEPFLPCGLDRYSSDRGQLMAYPPCGFAAGAA